jgi:hypothetical protein
VLFAHIRSGNVFPPNGVPHPKYGQPPCRYYTQVVDLDNTTGVSVVAEDARNPCLKILLNYTGATWRARDVRTDIAELLYARKMILARGTFGIAILFLSPLRKTISYSMSLSDPGFESLRLPSEGSIQRTRARQMEELAVAGPNDDK